MSSGSTICALPIRGVFAVFLNASPPWAAGQQHSPSWSPSLKSSVPSEWHWCKLGCEKREPMSWDPSSPKSLFSYCLVRIKRSELNISGNMNIGEPNGKWKTFWTQLFVFDKQSDMSQIIVYNHQKTPLTPWVPSACCFWNDSVPAADLNWLNLPGYMHKSAYWKDKMASAWGMC